MNVKLSYAFAAAPIVLAALLVGVGLSGAASAAVIYNNGAPDLVNAHHSDFDTSSPSDTDILGDDFTLGVSGVVRDVHWFGVYASGNAPPALDNFTIRFFGFSGPTPNTIPFISIPVGHVGRTDTASNIGPFDVYSYSTAVPDVPLAAGHYFLSIVNNTAGTNADWYWANSSQSGNAFTRSIDTNPWVLAINTFDVSFNLTDDLVAAVPEPATLALLGAGLAGLGFSRRKQ